jgi:hypothetical protein
VWRSVATSIKKVVEAKYLVFMLGQDILPAIDCCCQQPLLERGAVGFGNWSVQCLR